MIMPFGKHKGEDFEDIPSSYLKWICEKLDDDELVSEAEAELRYRKDHGVSK